MAVDVVRTPAGFGAGRPKPLFATQVDQPNEARNYYVVGRDGQRFLLARPVEESGLPPITVVLNWAVGHTE